MISREPTYSMHLNLWFHCNYMCMYVIQVMLACLLQFHHNGKLKGLKNICMDGLVFSLTACTYTRGGIIMYFSA